ncbi:MAG TPA: 2-C-methyl-D-erythritol 2,4-cyclodiphosphate synthase [Actinomycetota bacterium]|jgi:2-C-methyl-D-erythritol 2,4-cyclodiphosphate synthase
MNRVGIGFDAHAFDDARPLVLGGVTIPDHAGLSGHSDADVVSHAVGDALLGAAGLGDIGGMFPADEKWAGASSLDLLGEIKRALSEAGWSVGNVDSTIVAEEPRLAPHVEPMRSGIAAALGVSPAVVSVKATTTDHLGFTGRKEGIAAFAVALIENVG